MPEYKGTLTDHDLIGIRSYRRVGRSGRDTASSMDLSYPKVRAYLEWMDRELADLIPPPESPRMLVFDIENAPMNAWVWNMWKTNVIDIERDWYLLCFAYGWYDPLTGLLEDIGFSSIYQDPKFKPDTTDDSYILRRLWKLLDQADIVIGHNSDKFDIKKVQARMIIQGMKPPSPYQTIDTLLESRRFFGHASHSLKYVSRSLKVTLKETTEGFQLWRKCMRGEADSWEQMESYNRTDVKATAEIYTAMRPWIGTPGKKAHPNLGLFVDAAGWVCPKCGATKFIRRGYHGTSTRRYATVLCKNCGGYSKLAKAKRVDNAIVTTELR